MTEQETLTLNKFGSHWTDWNCFLLSISSIHVLKNLETYLKAKHWVPISILLSRCLFPFEKLVSFLAFFSETYIAPVFKKR